MSQCFDHCFDRDTTTVNAEGNGRVFVPGYTLDQGVLDARVTQVINKRMVGAVEGFTRIGNSAFRL